MFFNIGPQVVLGGVTGAAGGVEKCWKAIKGWKCGSIID